MAIVNPIVSVEIAKQDGVLLDVFEGTVVFSYALDSWILIVRHKITNTTFTQLVTKQQIIDADEPNQYVYLRFSELVNTAKSFHFVDAVKGEHFDTVIVDDLINCAPDKIDAFAAYLAFDNQYGSPYRRQLSFYDIGDGHLIPVGCDPEEL